MDEYMMDDGMGIKNRDFQIPVLQGMHSRDPSSAISFDI